MYTTSYLRTMRLFSFIRTEKEKGKEKEEKEKMLWW